jgi:hypothetical protein
MSAGSLIRSWPVALVLVASTGASLAVDHGGWNFTAARGAYPVRFALPAVNHRASAQLLTMQADAPLTEASVEVETPQPGPSIDRHAFDNAFADVGGTPPEEAQPVAEGVLALRFNLADPYTPNNDGTGPIELRKGVRINGTEAGSATIRVTDGATIAIARAELGKLLASAGRADLAEGLPAAGSYVTFDRIRQAGLSVRYDAASDRILLSS